MAVVGRTHIPVITHEKCNNCALCQLLCPDLAITRNEETDRMEVDYGYCKGCGICAEFCPRKAIEMAFEE